MLISATDEHAAKRHHALTALIQQEADRRGFISFARFMELALYAPGLGFYEHRGKAIGQKGDFFTSVSVGPLFGELLACHFERWLGKLPSVRPVLVEAGAHDGRLALDVLTALKFRAPSLVERLEYWLLEPSLERQAWQQVTLADFSGRVRWFQSWTDLSSFRDRTGSGLTGVVFANELLDAMPVHRLRWRPAARSWRELCVCSTKEGFDWIETAPGQHVEDFGEELRGLEFDEHEHPLWPRIPADLLAALPDGFTIEVCPAALHWWRQAAGLLEQGWLATFDYGLSAGEVFLQHRREGTLRGYREHRLTDQVLAVPGGQDLTAHVNFSALQVTGQAMGLATEAFCTQGEFLTRVFRDSWAPSNIPLTPTQVRQFQTLTHPQHLGSTFRVLVQSRGVSPER